MFIRKFEVPSVYLDSSNPDSLIENLKEDIKHELSWILNSISPQHSGRDLRVLDYGIPDFSNLSPSSGSDIANLKRKMLSSIKRFENRLSNLSIEVVPSKNSRNRLNVSVKGKIVYQNLRKDCSFLFAV